MNQTAKEANFLEAIQFFKFAKSLLIEQPRDYSNIKFIFQSDKIAEMKIP